MKFNRFFNLVAAAIFISGLGVSAANAADEYAHVFGASPMELAQQGHQAPVKVSSANILAGVVDWFLSDPADGKLNLDGSVTAYSTDTQKFMLEAKTDGLVLKYKLKF